jgi:hypothetical protein
MPNDVKAKSPPWDTPLCPRCGSADTKYYAVPFVSLDIYARCEACQFVWACGPFASAPPEDPTPSR